MYNRALKLFDDRIREWAGVACQEWGFPHPTSEFFVKIYRDGQLVVCCEIKEKSGQAKRLVGRMKSFATGVNVHQADRGNDALRKAKYLVTKRPKYFSVVAIGARLEFSVAYPGDRAFELREDLVPFV